MRRLLLMLFGLLICLCSKSVMAAEIGSIELNLPKEIAGEIIEITREGGEKYSITINENGIGKIENLEVGTYLIETPETSDYKFTTARVSIPTWSEEEEKMLYDVVVYPKYTQKEKVVEIKEVKTPKTSDSIRGTTYLGVGVISLIILVIMSCHNRFDCDTMTGKYSKNGGQNNGNDNDTENPRGTRRIGISSSGSID